MKKQAKTKKPAMGVSRAAKKLTKAIIGMAKDLPKREQGIRLNKFCDALAAFLRR